MLTSYELKMRFGMQEEQLYGRFQKEIITDPEAGMTPIIEYMTSLSFNPSEPTWSALLQLGWRFVSEPYQEDIRWHFLSPVITAQMLHKEDLAIVGKYLETAEENGMLVEFNEFKSGEKSYQEQQLAQTEQ